MKPILHFHIPKTGGQTLARRIAGSLPLDASWFMQGDITDQNYSTILDEIAAKRVFASAHVTGEVLVNENRFDLLCAVRDPVSHIISSINHILREPEHILHALAKNVSFERLLESCPEWFFNTQARYLAVALIGRSGIEPEDESNERWLSAAAYMACDRIRWLLTTDQIDSFCTTFAMDTGLLLDNNASRANIRPEVKSINNRKLQSWLRKRPHLFAIDSLLYNEAERRMRAYLRSVQKNIQQKGPWAWLSDDARTVYRGKGGEISLLEGWYGGIFTQGWGAEYRSGPELRSNVAVRRNDGYNKLAFTIAYVAGISPQDLRFSIDSLDKVLPYEHQLEGSIVRVYIDISSCPEDFKIAIRVPNIFPICVFNTEWHNTDRISFSCGNWLILKD